MGWCRFNSSKRTPTKPLRLAWPACFSLPQPPPASPGLSSWEPGLSSQQLASVRVLMCVQPGERREAWSHPPGLGRSAPHSPPGPGRPRREQELGCQWAGQRPGAGTGGRGRRERAEEGLSLLVSPAALVGNYFSAPNYHSCPQLHGGRAGDGEEEGARALPAAQPSCSRDRAEEGQSPHHPPPAVPRSHPCPQRQAASPHQRSHIKGASIIPGLSLCNDKTRVGSIRAGPSWGGSDLCGWTPRGLGVGWGRVTAVSPGDSWQVSAPGVRPGEAAAAREIPGHGRPPLGSA